MLETDHTRSNRRLHAPLELDDPVPALYQPRQGAMTFMRDGDGAREPQNDDAEPVGHRTKRRQ